MASKQTAKKGKPNSSIAAMVKHMNVVYEAAQGVISKQKSEGRFYDPEALENTRADVNGKVIKKRGKSNGPGRPKMNATPDKEIVAYVAKLDKGKLGACGVIRDVAKHFPEASIATLRACLPEMNPSTVQIQAKKARAAS